MICPNCGEKLEVTDVNKTCYKCGGDLKDRKKCPCGALLDDYGNCMNPNCKHHQNE